MNIKLTNDGDIFAPFFRTPDQNGVGRYICHSEMEKHFKDLPRYTPAIYLCFSKTESERAGGHDFHLLPGQPHVQVYDKDHDYNYGYDLTMYVRGLLCHAYEQGYRYVWVEYETE